LGIQDRLVAVDDAVQHNQLIQLRKAHAALGQHGENAGRHIGNVLLDIGLCHRDFAAVLVRIGFQLGIRGDTCFLQQLAGDADSLAFIQQIMAERAS